MPDLSRKTRLSPPLMHVFRAAHAAKDSTRKADPRSVSGDRTVGGRRLRARQVIDEPTLRREVARDLDALLNTVAMEGTVDMSEVAYVRKSILNYGLPDLLSHSLEDTISGKVRDEIRTAIVNYEPRLAAASLKITRDASMPDGELRVRFLVRADLVCEPVHVPIEFVADVTETGKIAVNRI
jgi:type VI secretion system protein ImpF